MSRSGSIRFLLAVVIATSAASAVAQSPATSPMGVAAVGNTNGIEERLKQLEADIAAMKLQYATKEDLQQAVNTITDLNQQQVSLIGDLQQEFKSDVNELKAQVSELRGIVDAISTQTPDGLRIPNLGNVQLNQRVGTFIVRNQMRTPQRIIVNDELRWVAALGGVERFQVRPGMVTTALPGVEGPKAWHVGPGNGYTTEIYIVGR